MLKLDFLTKFLLPILLPNPSNLTGENCQAMVTFLTNATTQIASLTHAQQRNFQNDLPTIHGLIAEIYAVQTPATPAASDDDDGNA